MRNNIRDFLFYSLDDLVNPNKGEEAIESDKVVSLTVYSMPIL